MQYQDLVYASDGSWSLKFDVTRLFEMVVYTAAEYLCLRILGRNPYIYWT